MFLKIQSSAERWGSTQRLQPRWYMYEQYLQPQVSLQRRYTANPDSTWMTENNSEASFSSVQTDAVKNNQGRRLFPAEETAAVQHDVSAFWHSRCSWIRRLQTVGVIWDCSHSSIKNTILCCCLFTRSCSFVSVISMYVKVMLHTDSVSCRWGHVRGLGLFNCTVFTGRLRQTKPQLCDSAAKLKEGENLALNCLSDPLPKNHNVMVPPPYTQRTHT